MRLMHGAAHSCSHDLFYIRDMQCKQASKPSRLAVPNRGWQCSNSCSQSTVCPSMMQEGGLAGKQTTR